MRICSANYPHVYTYQRHVPRVVYLPTYCHDLHCYAASCDWKCPAGHLNSSATHKFDVCSGTPMMLHDWSICVIRVIVDQGNHLRIYYIRVQLSTTSNECDYYRKGISEFWRHSLGTWMNLISSHTWQATSSVLHTSPARPLFSTLSSLYIGCYVSVLILRNERAI